MAREVKITLVVDSKGVVRGVRAADGSMMDLQATTDRTGRSFLNFGKIADFAIGQLAAQAVQALQRQLLGLLRTSRDVLASSVQSASRVEEMSSKFNVVFGEMADDARAWASDVAESTNRSRFAIEGYLASLQDTFVPMGFARGRATELSQTIAQLGIDLASFNNASEPETIDLLTSAITGNHRAVRRFGIVLSEARVQQELMRIGAQGLTGDQLELAKAQARLNIILADSGDAIGDAERTKDSYANTVRGLEAAVEELRVEMGNELLPAVTDVAGELLRFAQDPRVIEGARNIGANLAEQITRAASAIKAIIDFMREYRQQIGDAGRATAALTVAVIAYNTHMRLATLWTARQILLTKGLVLAQRALNLAMRMNPIGLIVSAIAAASVGFLLFRERVMEAGATVLDFIAGIVTRIMESGLARFFGLDKVAARVANTLATTAQRWREQATEIRKTREEGDELNKTLDTTDEVLEETSESGEKFKTAIDQAAEAVAKLRRQLADLEGTDLRALANLERDAMRLESRLRVLRAIVAELADPSTLAGADLADVLPEDAIEDRARAAMRAIPEAVRSEMEEAGRAMQQELDRMGAGFLGWSINLERDFGAHIAAIQGTLGTLSDAFRTAFETGGRESQRMFQLWKASATAEAIVSALTAANRALASAPPPFNFGLAAAVLAAGMANVARIRATQPGSGRGAGGGMGAAAPAPGREPVQRQAGVAVERLPGRARGGRIFAGEPIIAGERGPEPIFPAVDGMVIPSDVFGHRAGRGSGAGSRMTVDLRLEHEVTNFDLFELNTRLRRVEQFIQDGTGGG